jgi:protein-disulfide isomerase
LAPHSAATTEPRHLSRKRTSTAEIGRRTTIRSRQDLVQPTSPTSSWRSGRTARIAGIATIAGIVTLVVFAVGYVVVNALPKTSAAGAPGSTTAAGIVVPPNGTNTVMAGSRSLGLLGAPVTLTLWSDFQSEPSKLFSTNILPQLVQDYVDTGKVLVVWHDLATAGPESVAAATAARCADQQGKFWPYHDVLFANQAPANTGTLSPQRLKDMADAVGLDRSKFDACLVSTDTFNAVNAETTQGSKAFGDPPVLDFGGGDVLNGSPAYPELKTKIDGLLAAAAAAPTPLPAETPTGS